MMTKSEKEFCKQALSLHFIDKEAIDLIKKIKSTAPDKHIALLMLENEIMSSSEVLETLEEWQKARGLADLDGHKKMDCLLIEQLLEKKFALNVDIKECSIKQKSLLEQSFFLDTGIILVKGGALSLENYLNSAFCVEKTNFSQKDTLLTQSSSEQQDNKKVKLRLTKTAKVPKMSQNPSPKSSSESQDISTTSGSTSKQKPHLGSTAKTKEMPRRDTSRHKNIRPASTSQTKKLGKTSPVEPGIDGIIPTKKDDEHFLFGQYEIVNEIARGAMGIIYKAIHKDLRRVVALKVLKEGKQATIEARLRFQQEAKASASLVHPNIVTIYEWGIIDDIPFFSMELIKGRSLWDIIREDPPTLEQSLKIIKEIALGIHYAHTKGVIHRDLKSENIIIDTEGKPKIMDFGLAKSIEFDEKLTQSGYPLGTPYYMSPEQVRGELSKISARSDIYSLGVILYELITGTVPFTGASYGEVYENILHRLPPSLSEFDSKIPRDVESICFKALEKDPSGRYITAEAMSKDIERYLNGEPTIARPVGNLGVLWRRIKHYKSFVIIMLIISFICTASGMFISGTLFKNDSVQKGIGQVKDNKADAIDLLKKGEEALNVGEFATAFSLSEKSAGLYPADSAYLQCGIALYYLGEEREAKKILQKAPHNGVSMFYIGACSLRMGFYKDALDSFDQALPLIQDDKEKARAHYYRGMVHCYNKDYHMALDDCQRALKLNPDYFFAHCSRALLYIREKKYNEAEEDLKHASLILPFMSQPFYWRIYICMQESDQDKSVAKLNYIFTKAMQTLELSFEAFPPHMKDINISERVQEYFLMGYFYPIQDQLKNIQDKYQNKKAPQVRVIQNVIQSIYALVNHPSPSEELLDDIDKKATESIKKDWEEYSKELEESMSQNALVALEKYIQASYFQTASQIDSIIYIVIDVPKTKQSNGSQNEKTVSVEVETYLGILPKLRPFKDKLTILVKKYLDSYLSLYLKFKDSHESFMAQLYLLSAIARFENGQYSETLKAIEAAKELSNKAFSKESKALITLIHGWALYRLGLPRKAKETFKEIISSDISTLFKGHAYVGLGFILWEEGQNKEALIEFQNAFNLKSDRPDYNLFLAKTLKRLKREKESSNYYLYAFKYGFK